MQNRKTINPKYVSRIQDTVYSALTQHSRVMAVRMDMRLPVEVSGDGGRRPVVTRFFESLKAKLEIMVAHKEQRWGRKLQCPLRYVWVREFGPINGRPHFHAVVFLNKDVFHTLGGFTGEPRGLAALIQEAWSSALRIGPETLHGLVEFPPAGVYYLDANSPDLRDQLERLKERTDYLAKTATKSREDGARNFGCSR